MSNAIEVTAIRSGGWWAIEFATGAGIRYTQARRLDQVEGMVRDICNMDGVPVDDIHISPVVDPAAQEAIAAYQDASRTAQEAREAYAEASSRTATVLRGEGLTVRDISVFMGISPQRVSQLI